MNDIKIEYIDINLLKPSEYNPRQLTKKQAEDLQKSIEGFGMVEPIVVNKHAGREQVIVGGHQRYNICKKLGWTKMPVVYVDLDEAREKELNLRLNKNLGEWNWDMLANFDEEMLKQVGFDEELERMFPKEVEEDEAPEVSKEEPDSKLGEVYQLGRHRLMCGDATIMKNNVEKLMDGKKAQMIMADPPYNVGYTGGSTNKKERIDSYKDKWTDKQYGEWLQGILANAFVFTDDKSALHLWFADTKMRPIIDAIEGAGFELRNLIIWNKLKAHYGALGAQYKERKEPMWYAFKKGNSCRWYGKTNECTVWDVEQPHKNELHPTMKPISLYVKSVRNHTKKDDIVYEPFGGSGTTLIACEQTNRTCYMMELDPKYCDVIRKRYWKFVNDGNEEGWKEGAKKI